MRLQDKVCIVTGAGQGIGEAVAKLMAQEGGSVVVSDVNVENGEAVVAWIADRVGVRIDLIGVRCVQAVVTEVAHRVDIRVDLVVVRVITAVVTIIADVVAIRIGLIRI